VNYLVVLISAMQTHLTVVLYRMRHSAAHSLFAIENVMRCRNNIRLHNALHMIKRCDVVVQPLYSSQHDHEPCIFAYNGRATSE